MLAAGLKVYGEIGPPVACRYSLWLRHLAAESQERHAAELLAQSGKCQRLHDGA